MNRLRSLTAGAVVVGLLAGGAVYAQGGRDGGPGRGGRARGPIAGPALVLRGLALTETQQQQVRDIRARYRAEAEPIAVRVREAAQAQRKAVEAMPVNEGAIRATTFALAEAQTEAAVQQARMNAEVWSTLTAAQQDQVTKRQAEREARAAQRRDAPRQGR